ncbi:MAG: endolytic transglycosylase MltG, partial [Gammaproteobacteria bacterium]|nr:endolytic transglycosylase MltG [Gammaproteobacteria bacterium]
VFLARLERGMRLQTDPTVIYGLGDAFDGNLTRQNLREKTPYNTYRIDGLPPTPIALVGTASLIAVMQPIETNALYFVSKGDGSHAFSETLEEHNRNVRRYQLGQPE